MHETDLRNMFVGIDHGTTSVRFASSDGRTFEIPRTTAAAMSEDELLEKILRGLDVKKNNIIMIALTYSMGDGISKITPIDRVQGRGVRSKEGAGLHTGGGTRVFDSIRKSGIPAIVVPGLHTGNTRDARLNIFSHGSSPEKIGIVYFAHKQGHENFIVSDISSNTVTLAVAHGRLLGGLDACIFAPGIHHGPLDLAAIRDVDAGLYTANEAFTRAGVIRMTSQQNLSELISAFNSGDTHAALAFDTLALFASMEIVSMGLLLKDYDISDLKVFISGSVSELESITKKIEKHIGYRTEILGIWSAAKGCAHIAEDVHSGNMDILGIEVQQGR